MVALREVRWRFPPSLRVLMTLILLVSILWCSSTGKRGITSILMPVLAWLSTNKWERVYVGSLGLTRNSLLQFYFEVVIRVVLRPQLQSIRVAAVISSSANSRLLARALILSTSKSDSLRNVCLRLQVEFNFLRHLRLVERHLMIDWLLSSHICSWVLQLAEV